MKYIIAFFKTIWELFLGYLRYHTKIFKKSNFLHPDNILAIGFTILLLLSVFVLLRFAEAVDPLSQALSDADLTDFSYSQFEKNEEYLHEHEGELGIDDDIVLVNLGHLGRMEIAMLLDSVNKYEPAVVGIDARFRSAKDMMSDIMLEDAFGRTDKLVLACKGENYDEDNNSFDSLQTLYQPFVQKGYLGLVNLPTEDEGQLTMCRSMLAGAQIEKKDKYVESFVSEIAKHYDSEAYEAFKKRGNATEVINYIGNIHRDFQERPRDYFRTFDWDEFLVPEVNANMREELATAIEGKVVLIGFMGHDLTDNSVEDKFYTPLNEKPIGKAQQDMYGVVIHANALSMILKGIYINQMPKWLGYVFGFLIVYFVYAAYRPIYSEYRVWYDGLTKVMGLFLVLILVSILVISFYFFDYKIFIPGICFAIIPLAGDCLELYQGLLKNFMQRVKSNL